MSEEFAKAESVEFIIKNEDKLYKTTSIIGKYCYFEELQIYTTTKV